MLQNRKLVCICQITRSIWGQLCAIYIELIAVNYPNLSSNAKTCSSFRWWNSEDSHPWLITGDWTINQRLAFRDKDVGPRGSYVFVVIPIFCLRHAGKLPVTPQMVRQIGLWNIPREFNHPSTRLPREAQINPSHQNWPRISATISNAKHCQVPQHVANGNLKATRNKNYKNSTLSRPRWCDQFFP